jgi:hypothetical protein
MQILSPARRSQLRPAESENRKPPIDIGKVVWKWIVKARIKKTV